MKFYNNCFISFCVIYRITAVVKVKTCIIDSIRAIPIGRYVIMYVKIFKTDVIIFITYAIMCLMSH